MKAPGKEFLPYIFTFCLELPHMLGMVKNYLQISVFLYFVPGSKDCLTRMSP